MAASKLLRCFGPFKAGPAATRTGSGDFTDAVAGGFVMRLSVDFLAVLFFFSGI
jgi:hypothetical protein